MTAMPTTSLCQSFRDFSDWRFFRCILIPNSVGDLSRISPTLWEEKTLRSKVISLLKIGPNPNISIFLTKGNISNVASGS